MGAQAGTVGSFAVIPVAIEGLPSGVSPLGDVVRQTREIRCQGKSGVSSLFLPEKTN